MRKELVSHNTPSPLFFVSVLVSDYEGLTGGNSVSVHSAGVSEMEGAIHEGVYHRA